MKMKDPCLPDGRHGSQDWQQLTLARQRGRTTISDRGLNERVRDGNVCFPSSMITRYNPTDCQKADGLVVTAAVRDYGKFSLTSGNASVVRKNNGCDEWNVSDH